MKNYRKTLYDIFRTKTSENKNADLNDIMKGTKSILASNQGYESYIRNYFLSTKSSTFKSPEITEYPLLKNESSFLIPITTLKFKEKEKSKIFKKHNLLLESELFQKNHNNLFEDFNKRLNKNIKYNEEIKSNRIFLNKFLNKKNGRYNSLFLDFFNKWKSYKQPKDWRNATSEEKKPEIKLKNENPFLNFNIKERYFGLHYDENEIFNTSYDKFILSKLNYVKKNKIKNFINEIKSSFNDSNEKKIKLKIESIKLTFYPKNQEQNGYKKFYIFIPLSYVFLFYSYDFSFFQKILMSLLKFEAGYKTISFKHEGFINLLNSIIGEKEDNKEMEEEDILSKFKKGKYTEEIKMHKADYKNDLSEMRKTYNKQSFFANKFMRKPSNIFEEKEIKTKIIHSNKKFGKITVVEGAKKDKNEENKMIYSNNNKNNILYNEYYFIWETSVVTYDIKMEMPKIYFNYQNINHNIIAFCEKNLFLYLYKHNFINWDFYVLNYLFSFKLFRKIILNFFSLKNSTNFMKNLVLPNFNKFTTSNINTRYNSNLDMKENNNSNDEKNESKDIVISGKKILNQMSENNESYMFFYTDKNYDNHIINLFSYKIKIENQKLNPTLNWEFILNFKQMKYLNEVSKYEDLLTFLPKIIITNYEIGDLYINFDVFCGDFNAKILQNEAGHNPSKKKQLKIEVFKPHIESEIIGERKEKKLNKELNDNLLQNLNKLKMANWSRKILGIMGKDLIFKPYRASEVYTNKFEFFQKNPQKNEIQGRLVINKNMKKKLSFFGDYKNQNIDV